MPWFIASGSSSSASKVTRVSTAAEPERMEIRQTAKAWKKQQEVAQKNRENAQKKAKGDIKAQPRSKLRQAQSAYNGNGKPLTISKPYNFQRGVNLAGEDVVDSSGTVQERRPSTAPEGGSGGLGVSTATWRTWGRSARATTKTQKTPEIPPPAEERPPPRKSVPTRYGGEGGVREQETGVELVEEGGPGISRRRSGSGVRRPHNGGGGRGRSKSGGISRSRSDRGRRSDCHTGSPATRATPALERQDCATWQDESGSCGRCGKALMDNEVGTSYHVAAGAGAGAGVGGDESRAPRSRSRHAAGHCGFDSMMQVYDVPLTTNSKSTTIIAVSNEIGQQTLERSLAPSSPSPPPLPPPLPLPLPLQLPKLQPKLPPLAFVPPPKTPTGSLVPKPLNLEKKRDYEQLVREYSGGKGSHTGGNGSRLYTEGGDATGGDDEKGDDKAEYVTLGIDRDTLAQSGSPLAPENGTVVSPSSVYRQESISGTDVGDDGPRSWQQPDGSQATLNSKRPDRQKDKHAHTYIRTPRRGRLELTFWLEMGILVSVNTSSSSTLGSSGSGSASGPVGQENPMPLVAGFHRTKDNQRKEKMNVDAIHDNKPNDTTSTQTFLENTLKGPLESADVGPIEILSEPPKAPIHTAPTQGWQIYDDKFAGSEDKANGKNHGIVIASHSFLFNESVQEPPQARTQELVVKDSKQERPKTWSKELTAIWDLLCSEAPNRFKLLRSSQLSVGTHIHIGTTRGFWELSEIKAIAKAAVYFEEAVDMLAESAQMPKDNVWCRSNRKNLVFKQMFVPSILKTIDGKKTMEGIVGAMCPDPAFGGSPSTSSSGHTVPADDDSTAQSDGTRNRNGTRTGVGTANGKARGMALAKYCYYWDFTQLDLSGEIVFRRPRGCLRKEKAQAWCAFAISFAIAAVQVGNKFVGGDLEGDLTMLKTFVEEGMSIVGARNETGGGHGLGKVEIAAVRTLFEVKTVSSRGEAYAFDAMRSFATRKMVTRDSSKGIPRQLDATKSVVDGEMV